MSAVELAALRSARGRYPVANLMQDYLTAVSGPVKLGRWVSSLDDETLADVQIKVESFVTGEGVAHTLEDVVLSLMLWHSREAETPAPFDAEAVRDAAMGWYMAGLLEKLRRNGAYDGDILGVSVRAMDLGWLERELRQTQSQPI